MACLADRDEARAQFVPVGIGPRGVWTAVSLVRGAAEDDLQHVRVGIGVMCSSCGEVFQVQPSQRPKTAAVEQPAGFLVDLPRHGVDIGLPLESSPSRQGMCAVFGQMLCNALQRVPLRRDAARR